jgi:hypothetical protein
LNGELASPACFRPLPHTKVLEKLARKEALPRKLPIPDMITIFLPFGAV